MKKPFLFWCTETAALVIAVALPMLMHLCPGEALAAVSLLLSWVLYPVLSFLLPMWAAKHGASVFFCALPPFCIYLSAWLITGLTPPAVPCILTLVLAVIGACTGDEIRKRSPRRQK